MVAYVESEGRYRDENRSRNRPDRTTCVLDLDRALRVGSVLRTIPAAQPQKRQAVAGIAPRHARCQCHAEHRSRYLSMPDCLRHHRGGACCPGLAAVSEAIGHARVAPAPEPASRAEQACEEALAIQPPPGKPNDHTCRRTDLNGARRNLSAHHRSV